ncbi:response regulator [Spirosoma sp. BT702]|uniref:Response regulator n=1 Tax=Spirosoma profusum TaxID=2771354 RepID=A0A926XZR9_9BACT|nr:response regulator [Spirosoma profusum]MBD2703315.1 response regulator [Spirosoma profusum]
MAATFRILLVDDDPHLIDILRIASTESFPEAYYVQVHSYSEALNYFSQLDGHGPQLLLLDLNLGSMTGFELLKELRAHPTIYMLPIVVLTVSQLDVDVKKSYKDGASSFIRKPETLADWKKYVEQLRLYWLDTVTLPPIVYRKAAG